MSSSRQFCSTISWGSCTDIIQYSAPVITTDNLSPTSELKKYNLLSSVGHILIIFAIKIENLTKLAEVAAKAHFSAINWTMQWMRSDEKCYKLNLNFFIQHFNFEKGISSDSIIQFQVEFSFYLCIPLKLQKLYKVRKKIWVYGNIA